MRRRSGLALDFVSALVDPRIPSRAELRRWGEAVLTDQGLARAALSVRVVDAAEGAALNRDYRGRDYPTNVLSFPFDPPPGLPAAASGGFLGDLVLCAPVIEREAAEQGKPLAAHWAHLLVHGLLHLLGHDHLDAGEALRMEARERAILAGLGLPDPYADHSGDD